MKVWELMAKLAEMPAGADVDIAIFHGRDCQYVSLDNSAVMNGPAVQLSCTIESASELDSFLENVISEIEKDEK